ncbi:MAG: class I SAM-dependent methyltransferase [Pirellulales bacterium]
MFASDQYELIDVGVGRKLERFGPWILDRPCVAAGEHACRLPGEWNLAHARYERTTGERGDWRSAVELPERWTIRHGPIALEIKLTPFGHVGVFPEQADNWDWIGERIRTFAAATGLQRRPKVLNLFAYTGASTLAAAAARAEVVHIDAAANTVAWARRNAELSGLADAPIRWIVEDARKFVDREVRRGNKYDLVIADPPAYGHGPKGQPWELLRDLATLSTAASALVDPAAGATLYTHHSDSLSIAALRDLPGMGLKGRDGDTNDIDAANLELGNMRIPDRSGRLLHFGFFCRTCPW